jgi:steroid 5-alpha reductase family enzyme
MDMLTGNIDGAALGIAFALCLSVSALGFLRTDWFISIGYGFSIAAEAVLFALLYRGAMTPWLAAQLVLLGAYGVRLGGYLIAREASPSFGRELAASKERSQGIAGPVKFAIWISVSLLYVAMASPALFNLAASARGVALWSLPVGVVVMLAGLGLEAMADAQKARLKAQNPTRFVNSGLYGIVRSPNYFGEMLFWCGGFIAGLSAYGSAGAWLIAGAGVVCIVLIMLGSARRLEIKQAERYGSEPAYQDYVRRVPILLPFVPLYSLRRLRIYLG